MFDWNDEEISSILWGEAIDSGDHIVPYPEASDNCRGRKEWNLGISTNKSAEQKPVAHKIDLRDEKRGGILNFNANQEAAHIANDSENFQHLNGDKEQNNFVDYGWDNIGGFDDLDQIFSANNQLFGNGSHDHWPSSQDGNSSLLKSFPISVGSPSSGLGAPRKASDEFDVKNDDVEQYNKLGCGKPASQRLEKVDISLKGKPSAMNSDLHADSVLAENGTTDKVSRKRRLIKSRKRLVEKNNGNLSQDFYYDGSSSGNQFVSPIIQSPSLLSVLGQQRQLVGPLVSQEYQHNSIPFVGPTYGNIANSFSVTPVLSGVPSEDPKHQLLLSAYEISPVNADLANNSEDAPVKSLTMTPKEKIEKLRRRQQMQAMLAIQKKQQQLDDQATSIDDAINQNCDQENEIHHVDGANYVVDHPNTVALFDQKSTSEQDGSGTTSLAINGCTMEDTILFRLEEIVAKLDTRIRLCMRDSLFRLAQSATQRHHATVTNGSNDSVGVEGVANEDVNNSKRRDTTMSDAETETNPIDRTVAHLLFYRHVGLNVQYPDKPESPVSVKLQSELKPAGSLKNKSDGYLPENSKNSSSSPESQLVDQFRSSCCR